MTYLFDHPPVRRDTGQAGGRTPWWPPSRRTARTLLARRPSRLMRGRGFPNFSLLSDLLLARRLRAIRTGVLISTRPALHAAAARVARPGVVTIGQDHLNFVSRTQEPGSLALIEDAARRGLDAFVTLTPTDAVDYDRLLSGTSTRVITIPNALSWPMSPPEADDYAWSAAGRPYAARGWAASSRRSPRWPPVIRAGSCGSMAQASSRTGCGSRSTRWG